MDFFETPLLYNEINETENKENRSLLESLLTEFYFLLNSIIQSLIARNFLHLKIKEHNKTWFSLTGHWKVAVKYLATIGVSS